MSYIELHKTIVKLYISTVIGNFNYCTPSVQSCSREQRYCPSNIALQRIYYTLMSQVIFFPIACMDSDTDNEEKLKYKLNLSPLKFICGHYHYDFGREYDNANYEGFVCSKIRDTGERLYDIGVSAENQCPVIALMYCPSADINDRL